ncbi:MAG: helix-turn-helix transcriptional regulator, partial [Mycobacteriales bacterium]
SAELGLSPAGVRRHLDAMLASGAVRETTPPVVTTRGRGRPARVFMLTETGREQFPHSYDDIATAALRYLAETGGPDAVVSFANSRVAELEQRYRPRLAAAPAQSRAASLAAALTEDGYAATASDGVVCQHHCPVQHVAEEFPQLCEAETAVFSRLLGTPVHRLTTIAHGDGCCTAQFTPAPTKRTATASPAGRRSAKRTTA